MKCNVLLFTGHLIDPIDRKSERFPFGLIQKVQHTIEEALDELELASPTVAVSSLAAGGDMIFAEGVLKRKIPLVIFIPFEQEMFLAASVKYVKGIPGEDPKEWEDHFHYVLSQAAEVHELECTDELSVCYASCNEAMLNYALEHSNLEPKKVLALALMNNSTGTETGGTADFVNSMHARGIMIKKIWPG
ncbi:MAG: hypothetical protein OEV74_04280 [Cyclobacteriaceae bacterium]|nr:hypothetical protein [Cyclobacteriaceae bacterium]MDH4295474.1 hypothetical protein [Cyclobacteriaceae bacterium]MDH5250536.1 hypothetical protein [Cyclobacteriaceae bacterium]